ncbi:sulfotransferase [Prolixibacteraceae bacterium Z1-6]|uniref:Sulfotransferase n=1 Tax=Draconibacterium aestuarii TaxID=2998507 RepID=A0A9X3F8J3_9BACT|nr:sulfotransferase [Prolixibacteraceae bacterium Z1-6]
MKHIRPIQIIGTQRSGSNLLRLMLNQFDEITAPHPPHILQRFIPLLPVYGDLGIDQNFYKLIDDVCAIVERNPVVWTGVKFDREHIFNLCKSNTLFEIFRIVYDLKAVQDNASFWACKSMANIQYASEIENAGIRPMYIHLYRDGRDVACSFKKAIVGEKHVYHIANQWRKNQEACLALKAKVGEERFIQISYEKLIHSPEEVMKKLSSFLNIRFNPKVFDFYKSEESKNTAVAGKMWANVTQPIFKSNSNKYKKELTEMEVGIFERLAGNVLETLEYKLEKSGIINGKDFSPIELNQFDTINKQLKEDALKSVDPEGLRMREPQELLLKEIQTRNRHVLV